MYTIQIRLTNGGPIAEASLLNDARAALNRACKEANVQIREITEVVTRRTLPKRTTLELKLHYIRLRQKKLYCGNHPGPCATTRKPKFPRPLRKVSVLEALDWIKFNHALNRALDDVGVPAVYAATVWSNARDMHSGKTLWIRRDAMGRKLYRYTEDDKGRRAWVSCDELFAWEGPYILEDRAK